MPDLNSLRPRGRGLHFREAAFAFNLISAIAYAVLVYGETHDLDYYLLRAATRDKATSSICACRAVRNATRRRCQPDGLAWDWRIGWNVAAGSVFADVDAHRHKIFL
jgi:hypothetical protein